MLNKAAAAVHVVQPGHQKLRMKQCQAATANAGAHYSS
jgi:hypothetical protein